MGRQGIRQSESVHTPILAMREIRLQFHRPLPRAPTYNEL